MRSCSTRSSFTCVAGIISAISSRNSVPRCASSKTPVRRSLAPVNAPFSWPKISLSSSVSGIAAQLIATNGNVARGLSSWIVWATSSLPVPGLARDQHRCAGRRRLLDHAIHRPDPGAVADNAAEAALFAQLTPQRAHFAQRVLPFDRFLQEDLQPLRIDRFAQVVVGAFFDRFDGAVDRALRRQQDERDVAELILERAQQIEPRPSAASRDRKR